MRNVSRSGLWLGLAGLLALILAAIVWWRGEVSTAQPARTSTPAAPAAVDRVAPATAPNGAAQVTAGGPPAQGAPATSRTITVNGAGEASARPDQATVSLGTEVQAPAAGDAQSQNAAQINAVTAAVRAAGIPPENIQTSDVSLTPIHRNRPEPMPGGPAATPGAPAIDGYRAGATTRVKVPNVDQTGAIIDAAVKSGANKVQGIQFSLRDESAVRNQALANAVADAQRRASALAGAINVQITGVDAIVETGAAMPPRPMGAAQTAEAGVAAGAIAVEPGQQTVRVQVTVTFTY
ncbi:MAG TPA: SIMPL domain-containing protein [Dehalococcoidia bacterium]|nr:SIMPL domain-containing protein [Dehalococcoidia bacterium]